MRLYPIFVFLFLAVTSTTLKAEYFQISDYNVHIDLKGSKGTFTVTEVIDVDFSEPRHGVFRQIPYKYMINGKEVQVKINNVTVEGYNYDTYTEGNNFIIKIGDKDIFVNGRQTYKITYEVKKAFLFLEDHTEFYWNIIGNGWPVNINSVSFTIKMDEALVMSDTDYHIYTGRFGQQGNDATIAYYMDTFTGKTVRTLGPNEGVTLAINLPKEYVARPSEWELLLEKYGASGIGGLSFIVIIGLFYRTWLRYGKDYPIVKMVQYTIPSNISPSEAGVLIDERTDNVDILCLLPYWAHNGLILIKRIPKSWSKDDHQLTKLRELPSDAPAHEKVLWEALFDNTDEVLISDLKNTFYSSLQSAKSSLDTHIKELGIYYPVSINMQIYSFIFSFLLIFGGFGLGILFQSLILGLGLVIGGVIGLIFANHMLKKNEKGVHLYQQVVGFKMFIKAAEKDKLERMLKDDPDYFEKSLPYAMVFGYAKQWSKKFDGLLVEPPKWYVTPTGYYGSGGFTPADFGKSFEGSIQDIQSVFVSQPSSSGSSGGGGSFGGGGYSGGGFGGGGGGSW